MNHTDNTTSPEAAAVPPAADTPSAAAAAEATAAYAANATPAANGTADAAPASLEQRLSELEARHAEVSDAYLRAKAEVENVRRRGEEEVSKARKFAVEAFAESLLPVKDSLEAAIATPGANTAQVLEGVQATLRQLSQALERNKVVEVAPPAGTRFDPHQHQAISMVPADQEANTVVSVLQKGYLIAERVLRPALVTVAAPK
ncbi:nucleotide exchange factor GrpE [Azohydromonas australica]|uniref:nucleotide exchange factor GrpE n=1 Tax=Azohydromonas australica TaxID=364039 RepID=UPI000685A43D|nr:nucleotide exchange factor GrpE [Azohydromonas australica]